jgi:hypothetical protein
MNLKHKVIFNINIVKILIIHVAIDFNGKKNGWVLRKNGWALFTFDTIFVTYKNLHLD